MNVRVRPDKVPMAPDADQRGADGRRRGRTSLPGVGRRGRCEQDEGEKGRAQE